MHYLEALHEFLAQYEKSDIATLFSKYMCQPFQVTELLENFPIISLLLHAWRLPWLGFTKVYIWCWLNSNYEAILSYCGPCFLFVLIGFLCWPGHSHFLSLILETKLAIIPYGEWCTTCVWLFWFVFVFILNA